MFQTSRRSLVGIGIRIILLSSILIVTACKRDREWRQKLTFVVDTPNGVVSGYGIAQINYEYRMNIANTGGHYTRTSGEGAIVELGPDLYLFSALGPQGGGLLYAEMGKRGLIQTGANGHSLQERMVMYQETEPFQIEISELPGTVRIPRLLAFENINDPASVVEVDPYDLEATFGEGYHLIEVTIQGTREPMPPPRIPNVLPWWQKYWDGGLSLNGQVMTSFGASAPIAEILAAGTFRSMRE